MVVASPRTIVRFSVSLRAWVGAGRAALQDLIVATIRSYAAVAVRASAYRVSHWPPDASRPLAKLRLSAPRTLSPRVEERPQIGVLAAPSVAAQSRLGSALASSPPVSSIDGVSRRGFAGVGVSTGGGVGLVLGEP